MDVFVAAFVVYLWLRAWKSQIVFTNFRIVCCGGLLLKNKVFEASEIELWQAPVQKLILPTWYSIRLVNNEKGDKTFFWGLALTKEQLAFLENEFKLTVKTDWLGLYT